MIGTVFLYQRVTNTIPAMSQQIALSVHVMSLLDKIC